MPQERSAARSDGEALGAAVLFFGCCDESDYLFKSAALTVARMRRRPAPADPPTIRSFGARRSLVDAARVPLAGWAALCVDEMAAFLAEGVLSEMHTAFSRAQASNAALGSVWTSPVHRTWPCPHQLLSARCALAEAPWPLQAHKVYVQRADLQRLHCTTASLASLFLAAAAAAAAAGSLRSNRH